MSNLQPFFREAGSGSGIVCIHANASSSAQWRGLMDLLCPSYRVLAPDSYGSGKSPDWHSACEITLQNEADFIEPVFAQAGKPFALVGHSYGAAVALIAARFRPGRRSPQPWRPRAKKSLAGVTRAMGRRLLMFCNSPTA